MQDDLFRTVLHDEALEGVRGAASKDSGRNAKALAATTVSGLALALASGGCDGCKLSHSGRSQIVVFRGNTKARFMIVGEAPGAVEDACGKPFMGPAGLKLDEIIRSIDLDPNEDFYIGNIIKCRPLDESGIKQNLTPTHECAVACRPYIEREIELIKPDAILCVGLTAAKYLLDIPSNARMRDYSGRVMQNPKFLGVDYFITYHPAAILPASRDPVQCAYIKGRIWNDIREFRKRYVDAKRHPTGTA